MSYPSEQEESPIESMKRVLYTPGDSLPKIRRAKIHRESPDVPEEWEHESDAGAISKIPMQIHKHHRVIKWFFGFAVVFFIIAVAIAGFFLLGDRNILSADKIDITVTGPVSIGAGDTASFAIEIKNNNAVTLETADLVIDYPDGTTFPGQPDVERSEFRALLGDVNSGQRIATTTKAILFGKEGEDKTVTVGLEYRLTGSNAIFVKERTFDVKISSAPISVLIKSPEIIDAGQKVDMTVEVVSNSSLVMKNVVLSADYPFGFALQSAEPKPVFGDTVWELGDIPPEGKKTVRITGQMEGQNDEKRIFRFEVGLANPRDKTRIGTLFTRAEHTITVSRPFIAFDLTLNGKADDRVSLTAGGAVRGIISWRNNLQTPISDAVIELSLSGAAIDKRSVSVAGGFYDSSKNVIRWDKRNSPVLELIAANQEGSVEFQFETLASDSSGDPVNPRIALSATLKAQPVSTEGTPEQIQSTLTRSLELISDLAFEARGFYYTGAIDNSGPIPPTEGKETTYTIVWSIKNSLNDIENARVTARLPSYITWTGEVKPQSAEVTYNEDTGEVVWNVGTVKARTGYGSSPREVAFQISLKPSANQIGTSPVLINDASLTATDSLTGATVADNSSELTTDIRFDSGYKYGQDKVVADN